MSNVVAITPAFENHTKIDLQNKLDAYKAQLKVVDASQTMLQELMEKHERELALLRKLRQGLNK